MTRQEILDQYHPIRVGIRRALRLAQTACNRADVDRGFRQVAPWADMQAFLKSEGPDMAVDIALFEKNQRGRRAYDKFLEQKAGELDVTDRALAESMGKAWFSIFRVAEHHETAGLWLEDMLDSDRRLWLVDEGLETTAKDGMIISMRLFDAGPFHAGFGIVTIPDEDMTHFVTTARARGNPLPVRHSLAATLYGDKLRDTLALNDRDNPLMRRVAKLLESYGQQAGTPSSPAARRRKRSHRRKRQ